MEQHSDAPWDRIASMLSGDATPEEVAALEQWIAKRPEHRALVEHLRDSWTAIRDIPQPPLDVAALKQRIAASIVASPVRPYRVAARSRFTSFQRIATASLIVAGVAVAIVVGGPIMRRASFPSVASREYATTVRQQSTVTLPDGSRVTLAPQSRLTVASDFGVYARQVVLQGEAQFDVIANTKAPFAVQTGALVTRVLGTTFTVRRYEGDADVRVAVQSGKVAVGSVRAPATLTAGMIAHITDSTTTVLTETDRDAADGWVRGRLVFRSAPVREVLATVGRWYGYEFKLADTTLSAQRITTAFRVNEPSETMAALARLLDVNMTVDGDVVTLHPNRGRRADTTRFRGSPRPSRTTLPNTSEVGQ